MIKSFFISFIRSSLKNKKLLVINLLSLTASIALFFIIILFVYEEINFNKSIDEGSQVYRITTKVALRERVEHLALTNAFVGPFLQENFSEIAQHTRLRQSEEPKEVQINDNIFSSSVFETDTNFFKIFSFEFVTGNPSTMFKSNGDVVISQKFLHQYFDDNDVLNHEIKIDGEVYLISGVFKAPDNTDFDMDIIKSLDDFIDDHDWVSTFLVLKVGNKSLTEIETDIKGPLNERLEGQFNEDALDLSFAIEGLGEMHFSRKLYEPFNTRNKATVYIIFAGIIILILSSCFNYGNLSFALALNRIKEIALRKLYGAKNSSILSHTFLEVLFLILIGAIFSGWLIFLLKDFFTSILRVNYSFHEFFQPKIVSFFVIGLITMGLLSAAIFHIFFLSKIQVGIKSFISFKLSNLHRFLLVLQLSVSLIIIVSTYFILQQTKLVQQFEKGFRTDGVWVVRFQNGDRLINLQSLKNQLRSAGFDKVAFCNYNSIPGADSELDMFRLNNTPSSAEFMARKLNVDKDYFKVLEIPFEQRLKNTFSSSDVIVNNRLKKDQSIDSLGFDKLNSRKIIGVVNDFFFNSLYSPIEPIVFTFDSLKFNAALICLPNDLNEENFVKVKSVWTTFFPALPFDYVSLEDLHENLYHEDISLSNILLIISISIGTISLVGILSLSSLATINRLKEFAIRKILGADHTQISFLITREVGVLFIWAVLISVPGILFFMEYWLNRFAIKIGVNVVPILFIELLICFLTITFCLINARKVVNQNPVAVIRET